jgi:hypothetical protein
MFPYTTFDYNSFDSVVGVTLYRFLITPWVISVFKWVVSGFTSDEEKKGELNE